MWTFSLSRQWIEKWTGLSRCKVQPGQVWDHLSVTRETLALHPSFTVDVDDALLQPQADQSARYHLARVQMVRREKKLCVGWIKWNIIEAEKTFKITASQIGKAQCVRKLVERPLLKCICFFSFLLHPSLSFAYFYFYQANISQSYRQRQRQQN